MVVAGGWLNCSCRKSAQHQQTNNRITQPSGAATPRNSDAHKRIAVPKAFCVLRERTPGQDPKAAKFAVLIPGHAGFPKRAEWSEGSNSAPSETPPISPCVPSCAIFLREPSVYPFSSVKANVGHLWEKLKIGMRNGWGQSCGGIFADFFSSADGEGSQRTGKCMYIKAWQNKRDFTGGTKPHCGRGREGPVFRRVCPCVRSFSEGRVCTHFRL